MKIAIVVSTVGYHWEELYDAYKVFTDKGVQIDLFTVNGKAAVPDPKSLEHKPVLSAVGLGVNDSFDPETVLGKELMERTNHDVWHIRELITDNYDSIYLPGGHGCLFDVNINDTLHEKLREFYFAGKILSGVCHATSAFSYVKKNGHSMIHGKTITGFPEKLDVLLIKLGWVHDKFLPIPFSNQKLIKRAGANFPELQSLLNPFYHVVDLPFITGVGPKAATATAKAVVEHVKVNAVA